MTATRAREDYLAPTYGVRRGAGRGLLFAAWGLFLTLPLLGAVLYSVATVWRNEAFPDGFTMRWWVETLSHPRVLGALGRSVALGIATVAVVAALTLPALYWSYVRNPRIRAYLQVTALFPFALPFVVLAYGMKNLAGITALTRAWEASTGLLLLGHVALCFPFFLWPVDAALAGADVRRLSDAAETLGAGPLMTLRRIVLPNIRVGVLTGSVLAFATSFGEYSVAKVITGSAFETLPVWQVAALHDTRGNPNGLAVMAVVSFAITFLATLAVARVSGAARRPRSFESTEEK